jgi:hypothetical protein
MGNVLCGHALPADHSDQGHASSSKQLGSGGGGSAVSVVAVTVVAAGQAAAPAAAQGVHTDEIEAALVAARAELDAGAQQRFSDAYTVHKIIGHGASCKVQLCTHDVTGKDYAVKVVQKAAGNLKQRAGGLRAALQ